MVFEVSGRSSAAAILFLSDPSAAQGLHAAGAGSGLADHADPHKNISEQLFRQSDEPVSASRIYRALFRRAVAVSDATANLTAGREANPRACADANTASYANAISHAVACAEPAEGRRADSVVRDADAVADACASGNALSPAVPVAVAVRPSAFASAVPVAAAVRPSAFAPADSRRKPKPGSFPDALITIKKKAPDYSGAFSSSRLSSESFDFFRSGVPGRRTHRCG